MRKIVYIRLSSENFSSALLDACSLHSSLLEPLGEQDLLLDLSPFKRIGDIVRALAADLTEHTSAGGAIGLAASPLLAMLAVRNSGLETVPPQSFRIFQPPPINIVQVIPGQEGLFLSGLPLADFLPLSSREIRLLQRRGFLQVGELAGLGPVRLQQLLKRNTASLWQNILGRDYRPIKGLYPPQRLGYSLALAQGSADRGQLRQILEDAARELSAVLAQRHNACRRVELQLESGKGHILERKRHLPQACQDMSRLKLILTALLPVVLSQPVTGLRVELQELQAVEMRSPDLFTLRCNHQAEAKQRQRTAVMEQLLQRFPDRIGLGMEIERREKILRFWDPWRFASEGGPL